MGKTIAKEKKAAAGGKSSSSNTGSSKGQSPSTSSPTSAPSSHEIITETPKRTVGVGKGKTFGFGGIHAALRGRGASTKSIDKRDRQKTRSTTTKAKKRQAKRKTTYNYFIYKVLKQIHPQVGISARAMSTMNSFVTDVFERLANEASALSQRSGAKTLLSRDMLTAARLLLPGELGKHAISEGAKAVKKYLDSA